MLYDLFEFLQKRGCNVSISEVEDAIDVYQNYGDLKEVLFSTLGKTDICRKAIEDFLILKKSECLNKKNTNKKNLSKSKGSESSVCSIITEDISRESSKFKSELNSIKKQMIEQAYGISNDKYANELLSQIPITKLIKKLNEEGKDTKYFREKIKDAIESTTGLKCRSLGTGSEGIEFICKAGDVEVLINVKDSSKIIIEANGVNHEEEHKVSTDSKKFVKSIYDIAGKQIKKRVKSIEKIMKNPQILSNEEWDKVIQYDPNYLRDAIRKLLELKVYRRPTYTSRPSPIVNLSKTLKRTISYGGKPAEIVYERKSKIEPRALVVIDVSGSMYWLYPYINVILDELQKLDKSKFYKYIFVDRLIKAPNKVDESYVGFTDFEGLYDIEKVLKDKKVPVIVISDFRQGYGANPIYVIEQLKEEGYRIYPIDIEPKQYWGEGDSCAYNISNILDGSTPKKLAQAISKIIRER